MGYIPKPNSGNNSSEGGVPPELSNVDNTSDLNKPISTATQSALDLKADESALDSKASESDLNSKANNSAISNVDNTSDLDKPISTATQTALDLLQSQIDDLSTP